MPYAKPDQTVLVKAPGMYPPRSPGNTTSLKRIYDVIPDVKLLLVLRNPIDRVVSDILHEYMAGRLKGKHMPDINDIIMNRTGFIPLFTKGDFIGDLLHNVLYLTNYTFLLETITSVFPKDNITVYMFTFMLKQIRFLLFLLQSI